ncbi:hypothetical protein WR25_18470 [Diploscapter pachys]|uniref:Uncharacterized protein n=1 Tax=Diploscapter pachys TaxID=2018661 RepID=A0A2A2JZX9_9BILA|nr:hypothetical protein WR25_18470 [Diploscapter pachys]
MVVRHRRQVGLAVGGKAGGGAIGDQHQPLRCMIEQRADQRAGVGRVADEACHRAAGPGALVGGVGGGAELDEHARPLRARRAVGDQAEAGLSRAGEPLAGDADAQARGAAEQQAVVGKAREGDRRLGRIGGELRQIRLFLRRAVEQLPEAEADHRGHRERDDDGGDQGDALHGVGSLRASSMRPSRAAFRYSAASSAALATRSDQITPAAVTGIQISMCSHSGGCSVSSSVMAPATTNAPRISVRKAAGPSPTLKRVKSRPQPEQRSANLTQPANKRGRPQRGHSPFNATSAIAGEDTGVGSVMRRPSTLSAAVNRPAKKIQPPPLALSAARWPPCIHMIAPLAITSAESDPNRGQMLGGRM